MCVHAAYLLSAVCLLVRVSATNVHHNEPVHHSLPVKDPHVLQPASQDLQGVDGSLPGTDENPQGVPGDQPTQMTEFKNYCKKLCQHSPCPVECTQAFLDPWTLSKRSVRYNGLTFDDYLFMRWLGRDMIHTGMRR